MSNTNSGDRASGMTMDVGKALLNDSEHAQLQITLQAREMGRHIQRDLDPAAL